jgi:hypothetical protein
MGVPPALASAAMDSGGTSGAALGKKRKRKKKKASSGPVQAYDNAVTPERMEAYRDTLRAPAQADISAGNYARAAKRLERLAIDYGDPVLFLDAGDAWLYEARSKKTMEPVRRVTRTANIAIDIVFFLEDVNTWGPETHWKVVPSRQLMKLIERAEAQLDEADTHAAQIKSDVSGRITAEEEKQPEEEEASPTLTPEPKPYRAMVAAGASLLSVGLVGLGVMGTGIALGLKKQSEIDALQIPGEDQMAHEITQEGDRANVIAYLGLSLGLAGLLTGIPLLVVGQKRKKDAGGDRRARLRVSPALGGLTVQGRF